jgi:hypothetical protein
MLDRPSTRRGNIRLAWHTIITIMRTTIIIAPQGMIAPSPLALR